jgi:hypothetical protein
MLCKLRKLTQKTFLIVDKIYNLSYFSKRIFMHKKGKNNGKNKSPGLKKRTSGHEDGCRIRTLGQQSSFRQKNKK